MNDQEQTQAVAEAKPKKKTIADILAEKEDDLRDALAKEITVDYFVRTALTTIQKDSRIMQATTRSLTFALLEAAQLRLVLDGHLGHAYLVAFWSKQTQGYEVKLMVGYKGLMHMARRSGEISKIEPRVVYEGDRFEYAYGLEQRLVHVPAPLAERGGWTHVYAIGHFRDKDVRPQFEVMPQADVFAIRDRSPGGRSDKKTPWDTDEVPMSLKSVIKKLCKWLPMGLEDQRQLEKEEQFDARVPDYEVQRPAALEIGDLASTEPPPQAPSEAAGEDEDEEAPMARNLRQAFSAGEEAGLWTEESFYEEWIVGELGMMPASKALGAVWEEIPEDKAIGLLAGMQSVIYPPLEDETAEEIEARHPELFGKEAPDAE
jgi:recombination protein RecT